MGVGVGTGVGVGVGVAVVVVVDVELDVVDVVLVEVVEVELVDELEELLELDDVYSALAPFGEPALVAATRLSEMSSAAPMAARRLERIGPPSVGGQRPRMMQRPSVAGVPVVASLSGGQ